MHKVTAGISLELLDRMRALKVLVVGDVMLDHYVWGEVHRISPEAPVPVISVLKETFNAGGAANVALNLAALGIRVSILSAWGADAAGRQLDAILDSQGIRHEHSVSSNAITTIVKKRIVARNQQLCRVDYEGPPQMYSMALEDSERCFAKVLGGFDAVIVSDYAKGFITQSLIDTLMLQSRVHKVPVAVDPKPRRQLNFHCPWLMTPNRQEAIVMSEIQELDPRLPLPISEICDRIQARVNPDILVVTLGADGMVVSLGGQELGRLPTFAKEVFDVSGAGDTVIATLVAALLAGADCVTAAKIANVAAGCVVAHLGTVPINRSELETRLARLEDSPDGLNNIGGEP